MGGSVSSSRMTVDNENVENVISISESVVERIRDDLKNAQSPPAGDLSAGTSQASSLPPPAAATPADGATSVNSATSSAGASDDGAASWAFSPEAVMTVVRMRQERETALQQLDAEWRQRLAAVEQQQRHLPALADKAFCEAAHDTRQLFTSTASVNNQCVHCQESVTSCYLKNSGRPLLCDQEVQKFADCVKQARTSLLAS